jgi:hypothetical protein
MSFDRVGGSESLITVPGPLGLFTQTPKTSPDFRCWSGEASPTLQYSILSR